LRNYIAQKEGAMKEFPWKSCGCILLVVVFGGTIIGTTVWFSTSPAAQLSAEAPKPGFWQGRGAQFVLDANGKINNLHVWGVKSVYSCGSFWEDGPTLTDNRFSMEEESNFAINSMEGRFMQDGKFHGTYHLQICGQWHLSKNGAAEGTWDAEWVSDKETTPTPWWEE
jgi:hypothetical protein